MTSEWRHRNKTHSRYSELNSLQNVYFGFFIFGNLTEWRCFVTYLSNDPRIMCTELWKLVVIHRLSLWLLSVADHRVKVGLWWLLTDWRINYCSDITIPGIGFFATALDSSVRLLGVWHRTTGFLPFIHCIAGNELESITDFIAILCHMQLLTVSVRTMTWSFHFCWLRSWRTCLTSANSHLVSVYDNN